MKLLQKFLVGTLVAMAMSGTAWAQDPVGKWVGTLKAPGQDLPLVLIVIKDGDGNLSGRLESTSQAPGQWIPVDTVATAESPNGIALNFAIAALGAEYKSVWNADVKVWVGTLTQNAQPMKMTMTRAQMPATLPW